MPLRGINSTPFPPSPLPVINNSLSLPSSSSPSALHQILHLLLLFAVVLCFLALLEPNITFDREKSMAIPSLCAAQNNQTHTIALYTTEGKTYKCNFLPPPP
eukprot:c9322_g1_i1 orf=3-305(-)